MSGTLAQIQLVASDIMLADVSGPSDGTSSNTIGNLVSIALGIFAVAAAAIIGWHLLQTLASEKGAARNKSIMQHLVAFILVEGILAGIWAIAQLAISLVGDVT